MDKTALTKKAELLRALHKGPEPLVLPNPWDAASAVLVAEAGFPAIATTSAGVAWMLGRPDGQHLTRDEMLGAVARIAAVVSLPVTADLEAGYGDSPGAVAATVRGAAGAGAVGLNTEDGIDHTKGTMYGFDQSVARIAAARKAADELGVPMVINARTDLAFDRARPEAERIAEAIQRGNAYMQAGADCVYPILFQNIDAIKTLAAGIKGPINVMASTNLDVATLKAAGVRRISLATGLPRVVLARLKEVLTALKADGKFDFLQSALPTPDLNAKFPRK